MGVTNPRVVSQAIIGFDWQASEGEAVPGTPYTPKQFIVAQVFSRNPDPSYIHPQGTHGSIFRRKDGERIVSQAFKKEVKFWGGRFQIMPFLESVMGGQPTIAFADLVLTGAGAAQITTMSLIGARPYHNSSPYVYTPPASPTYYIKMTNAGFPVTFQIYRDSARTLLVGTCSVSAAATPTAITESNSSGLTGSVTLGSAGTNNADAAISKVTYAFASQHARYFRMFYTDGTDAYALSDCVVESLKFESTENGALEVTAMVMGKRRTITAASTFLPIEAQLDLVCYSHSELTLTKDPAGTPVIPAVDSYMFQIRNNVLQYIANSATPQKLIKRGWVDLVGNFKGETSDELTKFIVDARSNTAPGTGFNRMQLAFLLAAKTFLIDLQQFKPQLKEPGVATELIEKTDVEFDAFYDGVTSPAAITIQV